MTEQPLELLTEIDIHFFIESNIRVGISIRRFTAANNKCSRDYNREEAS